MAASPPKRLKAEKAASSHAHSPDVLAHALRGGDAHTQDGVRLRVMDGEGQTVSSTSFDPSFVRPQPPPGVLGPGDDPTPNDLADTASLPLPLALLACSCDGHTVTPSHMQAICTVGANNMVKVEIEAQFQLVGDADANGPVDLHCKLPQRAVRVPAYTPGISYGPRSEVAFHGNVWRNHTDRTLDAQPPETAGETFGGWTLVRKDVDTPEPLFKLRDSVTIEYGGHTIEKHMRVKPAHVAEEAVEQAKKQTSKSATIVKETDKGIVIHEANVPLASRLTLQMVLAGNALSMPFESGRELSQISVILPEMQPCQVDLEVHLPADAAMAPPSQETLHHTFREVRAASLAAGFTLKGKRYHLSRDVPNLVVCETSSEPLHGVGYFTTPRGHTKWLHPDEAAKISSEVHGTCEVLYPQAKMGSTTMQHHAAAHVVHTEVLFRWTHPPIAGRDETPLSFQLPTPLPTTLQRHAFVARLPPAARRRAQIFLRLDGSGSTVWSTYRDKKVYDWHWDILRDALLPTYAHHLAADATSERLYLCGTTFHLAIFGSKLHWTHQIMLWDVREAGATPPATTLPQGCQIIMIDGAVDLEKAILAALLAAFQRCEAPRDGTDFGAPLDDMDARMQEHRAIQHGHPAFKEPPYTMDAEITDGCTWITPQGACLQKRDDVRRTTDPVNMLGIGVGPYVDVSFMRKYFDVASLVTDPSDSGMLEGVADVVAKAWPMLYAGREGQLVVHHGSIVGFHGSSTRLERTPSEHVFGTEGQRDVIRLKDGEKVVVWVQTTCPKKLQMKVGPWDAEGGATVMDDSGDEDFVIVGEQEGEAVPPELTWQAAERASRALVRRDCDDDAELPHKKEWMQWLATAMHALQMMRTDHLRFPRNSAGGQLLPQLHISAELIPLVSYMSEMTNVPARLGELDITKFFSVFEVPLSLPEIWHRRPRGTVPDDILQTHFGPDPVPVPVPAPLSLEGMSGCFSRSLSATRPMMRSLTAKGCSRGTGAAPNAVFRSLGAASAEVETVEPVEPAEAARTVEVLEGTCSLSAVREDRSIWSLLSHEAVPQMRRALGMTVNEAAMELRRAHVVPSAFLSKTAMGSVATIVGWLCAAYDLDLHVSVHATQEAADVEKVKMEGAGTQVARAIQNFASWMLEGNENV